MIPIYRTNQVKQIKPISQAVKRGYRESCQNIRTTFERQLETTIDDESKFEKQFLLARLPR